MNLRKISVDDKTMKLTTSKQTNKENIKIYKLTNNEELQRPQAIKYSCIKMCKSLNLTRYLQEILALGKITNQKF